MTSIQPPIVVQRSYIDGSWIELEDSGRPLCDPNTGEVRQPKLTTTPEQVERALDAAYRFDQDGLARTIPLSERVEFLEAFAEELDRQQEAIAVQDAITTGATIRTTRLVAASLGARVRSMVSDAVALGEAVDLGSAEFPVKLLREPIGPAVIIAPWNVPAFTASGKVAAALLAGCPVILKPSENTPTGVQVLAEILVSVMESRGLPPAYFQLVQGGSSIGSLLTSDRRVAALVFTGGVETGRTVAQEAASALMVMQMELGSNNTVIVREDADVRQTAASLVQGTTRVNGQWCEAPGKVLVHERLHDDLAEALREEFDALQIGSSLDDETQLGPLAFERHRDALRAEVARLESLGGRFIGKQELPALDGWFVAPGVIVGVDPEHATTELFGPLLTLHSFSDDEQALRLANAPEGGLDAYVFSADIEAAMTLGSRIRAGEIRINGTFMSDLADGSQQTFWGSSGIGGHAPQYGVRFFLGDRVVGVDSGAFEL
ncbi:phenylacetaldehyde dehydrogenase [Leucobacter komagatae]|uniref:Phenylacetaldehyde dehydrogenase n=1 Tax=Leucobacter komagatae TaxID=55969 RepID=A0A542Y4A9_9MICO|nr:aldehyde dehydrogenase [Leucobacter komagatae]TQL42915.1 phenylacetaldehyde dehydrogenase [Leucobacter komagatae]